MSPEFDALLATYFATVPVPERIQALGEIIRQMSDRLTTVGLYYNPRPAAVANRVLNLSQEWVAQYITWNAHEWDVRD